MILDKRLDEALGMSFIAFPLSLLVIHLARALYMVKNRKTVHKGRYAGIVIVIIIFGILDLLVLTAVVFSLYDYFTKK